MLKSWVLILYILTGSEPVKEVHKLGAVTATECTIQGDKRSKELAAEYETNVLMLCILEENYNNNG